MSNPIGRPRMTGPIFPNCGHTRDEANVLPNGGCRLCDIARKRSDYAAKHPDKHLTFNQERGELTGQDILREIRRDIGRPAQTDQQGRSYNLAPRRELVPERKTG